MLRSGAGKAAGGRDRDKWREGWGKGGRQGVREGEASMRKGCSEVVCREEARISSHCRYRCLGQVMEHDGEFCSLHNTLRWQVRLFPPPAVPASRLPDCPRTTTDSLFRTLETSHPWALWSCWKFVIRISSLFFWWLLENVLMTAHFKRETCAFHWIMHMSQYLYEQLTVVVAAGSVELPMVFFPPCTSSNLK